MLCCDWQRGDRSQVVPDDLRGLPQSNGFGGSMICSVGFLSSKVTDLLQDFYSSCCVGEAVMPHVQREEGMDTWNSQTLSHYSEASQPWSKHKERRWSSSGKKLDASSSLSELMTRKQFQQLIYFNDSSLLFSVPQLKAALRSSCSNPTALLHPWCIFYKNQICLVTSSS